MQILTSVVMFYMSLHSVTDADRSILAIIHYLKWPTNKSLFEAGGIFALSHNMQNILCHCVNGMLTDSLREVLEGDKLFRNIDLTVTCWINPMSTDDRLCTLKSPRIQWFWLIPGIVFSSLSLEDILLLVQERCSAPTHVRHPRYLSIKWIFIGRLRITNWQIRNIVCIQRKFGSYFQRHVVI